MQYCNHEHFNGRVLQKFTKVYRQWYVMKYFYFVMIVRLAVVSTTLQSTTVDNGFCSLLKVNHCAMCNTLAYGRVLINTVFGEREGTLAIK